MYAHVNICMHMHTQTHKKDYARTESTSFLTISTEEKILKRLLRIWSSVCLPIVLEAVHIMLGRLQCPLSYKSIGHIHMSVESASLVGNNVESFFFFFFQNHEATNIFALSFHLESGKWWIYYTVLKKLCQWSKWVLSCNSIKILLQIKRWIWFG